MLQRFTPSRLILNLNLGNRRQRHELSPQMCVAMLKMMLPRYVLK
jgi:hypothetical protein